MIRRNHEMPLDPDVERELAAIDAGLLGLEVAPDLEDLAELRARRARRGARRPNRTSPPSSTSGRRQASRGTAG